MELVYLWVEEYKNIHRQGFNFSPRFNCHYDEASKELTIDENDDYIENFFGGNINVTAIVGKNGSGKSSIFEVLAFLYWGGSISGRREEDKTFFLYRKKNQFFIQCENCHIHHDYTFKDFITIHNNTDVDMPTHFAIKGQMPLVSFSNCISDMTYNKNLESLKRYENFYNGVQPEEPMMKSAGMYDNFNQKFQDILKREESFFDFINKNLLFNNFQIELHIYELGAWFAGNDLYEKFIIPKNNEALLSFGRTESSTEDALYRTIALYLIFKCNAAVKFNKYHKKEDEQDLIVSIFDKIKGLLQKEFFGEKEYKKVLDICFKEIPPSRYFEHDSVDRFPYEAFNLDSVKKIINKYTFSDANIFTTKNYNVGELKIENAIDTVLEEELMIDKLLRINFLKNNNNNYSFLNLSSGEKLYLNLLTNFAYTLYHLKNDYKGIILLDEIELSFHPDWQKKIIEHLLHIYNKVRESKNIDLHLIFTSHSPFLLSDIPKQNIIFLDTDENGKCKVLTQDQALAKQQTFGQNIHALLSDSFFMEDGLMGEFAKEKINKIIKYLRDDSESENFVTDMPKYDNWLYDKENLKKIIDAIGEPFLRHKILELYYDKFTGDATEAERKKELLKQKERIERELSRYD